MNIAVWPDTVRRNEFFAKLEALIQQYPELTTTLSRQYAAGSEYGFETEGDWPPYDPNSPTMINGLVLVITTVNMDGWEDLVVTEPTAQSRYLTGGIVSKALELIT